MLAAMSQPAHPMRTLHILWGAILSSTVMIFGASFVVEAQPSKELALLLPAFGFLGLNMAVLSFWLPPKTAVHALQRVVIPTREIDDPMSLPGSGRTVKVPTDPASAHRTVLQLLQPPLILRLALGESVALFGFVLHVMGAPVPHILPFFVVCWVLHFIAFPSDKAMLAFAQKHTGVRLDLVTPAR
jgi:hypothetical protein